MDVAYWTRAQPRQFWEDSMFLIKILNYFLKIYLFRASEIRASPNQLKRIGEVSIMSVIYCL